ncbi:MAG: biotin transporter BioY [Phycisphaerae bacterium]|nr:biotin transporter BioY [Phycisphaerae bacterium]
MSGRVYADVLRPSRRAAAAAYDLGLVLAGSVLLAACAQVKLFLPFTAIPITAQTFAVLLLGVSLGRWRGVAAVTAYLAQGAAGLPVFAVGGGVGYLAGPTAGFLWGFVPAAWLAGALAEHGWDRRPLTAAGAMALADAALFTPGVLWYAGFVGLDGAVSTSVVPFLPGEAIKIALATALLPTAWRLIGDRPNDANA